MLSRSTWRRPATGSFQIAERTSRPRHLIVRGRPTFTASRRMRLVGLLVTLHSKDRPPAPPGKDADPKESLRDFEGRGRSMAVVGDRRFRVERCVKAHWLPCRSTRPRSLHGTERSRTAPNRVGITE